jgi:hypothetical protein
MGFGEFNHDVEQDSVVEGLLSQPMDGYAPDIFSAFMYFRMKEFCSKSPGRNLDPRKAQWTELEAPMLVLARHQFLEDLCHSDPEIPHFPQLTQPIKHSIQE